MPASWAAACSLAAALAVLGCGEPPAEGTRIVERLVDADAREGAVSEPAAPAPPDANPWPPEAAARIPTATIADDTRTVLFTHPDRVLAYRAKVDPVSEGVVVFSELLYRRFPDAEWLFLAPHLRLEGGKWSRLPGVLSRVEREGGQPAARLELEVEGARPGSPVELTLRAYRPPPRRATHYATPELEIPARARLEFAFGILAPAAAQPPVRFSLSACRAGDCRELFEETLDPRAEPVPAWNDRSVSLAAVAGGGVSLHFDAEPATAGAQSLPVWANPTLVTDGAPAAPRVVLLSIDTLRRDRLDVYGHSRETAPFLRSHFTREGVVFDNLISEAATTDPSHMTLFTSLPALAHGVGCCGQRLTAPVPPLAEVFRRHGYATAAFTEDGPLGHERGFSIGFDSWMENRSASALQPVGQVHKTFAQARDWLARKGDRPFFLFLHTFQVHGPYDPPKAYRSTFGSLPDASSERERKMLSYDREIRYVDDELRQLHAWMQSRGLNDDTLWFVLSDHGEEFYEHGSLGHGTLPYEQVLRVPLLVAGPGLARGVRSSAPLHHLDLMPTILELAGVPVPAHVRGRSFADLVRGGSPDGGGARPRFSATWILPEGLDPPALAVQVGSRKLIRFRDGDGVHTRLFDLAGDPAEERDLSESRAPDATDLEALLAGYERDTRRIAEELRAGTPASAGQPAVVPPDPEREEELRALGYIE